MVRSHCGHLSYAVFVYPRFRSGRRRSHQLRYVLRNKETASPTFRLLVDELVTLLAYEATRDVRVEPHEIETPVTTTIGVRLAEPRPLVVPILRAGLGMLEGMTRLLPTACRIRLPARRA